MSLCVSLLIISVLTVTCLGIPPQLSVVTKSPQNAWNSVIQYNLTTVMKLYSYGNKNYYINFDFKATYFEAIQFCEEIDMQLVSIQSKEENDKLFNYIRDSNRGDYFWSSGTNLLDATHWIWLSKLQVAEYTNWRKGEPNNANERCLELNHMKASGLFWNDRDCHTPLPFICEREYKSVYEDTVGDNYTKTGDDGMIFKDPYTSPNIPLFHFNDKSYFVGRYYKATFLEALQLCRMIKMHLIEIHSVDENKRLHKYLRDTTAGDKFWSSGTRIVDGKSWVWIGTAQSVEYTQWATNEPDNQNHLCILLGNLKNDGLFWYDNDCKDRNFYICEKPKDYVPSYPPEALLQGGGRAKTVNTNVTYIKSLDTVPVH